MDSVDSSRSPKVSEIIIWLCTGLFIFLFPHTGLFPLFTYCIPVLLVIWFVLRRSGESFYSIGFRLKALTFKAAAIGILSGMMLFAFMHFLFFPLLKKHCRSLLPTYGILQPSVITCRCFYS